MFLNLQARGENGQTGGIIEPLIVEWIMDYGASSEGETRGGEGGTEGRRKGKGRKGCMKGTCCASPLQGSSGLLRKRENSNPV